MKPPFQNARPQHQYSATRADDQHSQRSNVRHPSPSIQNTPLVIPQMYVQGHSSIPPQYLAMLPKPGNPPYHLDHQFNASMIQGSLPRPQIPTVASMSTPHPSTSYQAKRPSSHRVSLLQDIRISGERDRDVLSSNANLSSDAHGIGLSYGGSSQPRRTSLPASQGALARPMERASGPSPHSAYQPHIPAHAQMQKDHPSNTRHSIVSTPQSFPMFQTHPDVKKEPLVTVKQEVGPKHPHPHLATGSEHAPQTSVLHRQPNVKTDQSVHPAPAVVEQKSKEDLVQAMDKVDREIAKVETEIGRLQKKKTQLEESAMKPPEPAKSDTSPQRAEPKHRDLWQVIYAENRKKAEAARSVLDGLCKKYEMPLYNQPSDTDVYQKNIEKNEEMRPKLLTYFQNRMKLQNIREQYLCARYDQLMGQWHQKTEEIESNPKRKAKEVKSREFFEKLFPEVRKQREQQERIERVGTRGDTCRSEADLAEIVDGLSEQENQLHHMRQLAVIPPMLLDKEQRRIQFINNNGFINEPFKEFKESQQLDAWSDQEKSIFKEKFVQHPKNFQLVASFIEKKSVSDCILYYYLTKKTNHYKALIRKQTLKPKKLKSGKHHNFNPAPGSTKDVVDKNKEEIKKEGEMEQEEVRVDKPPSPRMTRARKQTMNWTEGEISVVKEGFGRHGRDFSAISRMVANKTEQQVKNFYHNYKKKHGLDQLIKKTQKKTGESRRTRHHAQSPDIVATATEEDERKNTESPLMDEKVKGDKMDDPMMIDDKKQKGKDRTPSPAISTSGKVALGNDGGESASISTTHIRTRRTAALAAASTGQDSPESTSTKRPSSSKSPVLSQGEPAEKKQKKNEKKGRREKTSSESSTKDAKTLKDEVKDENGETTKCDEVKDVGGIKEDGKSEDNVSDLVKPGTQPDVATNQESSLTKTNSSNVAKQQGTPLRDDDSSATCSADEDTTTESHGWKVKQKSQGPQDAFDYDFNDSPVINLNMATHTATCATVVTSSMPSVISGVISSMPHVMPGVNSSIPYVVSGITSSMPLVVAGVTSSMPHVVSGITSSMPLVVAGVTPSVPRVMVGATSTTNNAGSGLNKVRQLETPSLLLNRPQSLPPPGAMVPPQVSGATSSVPVISSKHGTIITSVADNSRPNSTPAGAHLSMNSAQTLNVSRTNSLSNREPAVVMATTQPVSIVHRQPVPTAVIENIRGKPYHTGKMSVPFVSVSSSGRTFTVSMPHVMDLTADKKTSTTSVPSSMESVKLTTSALPGSTNQHRAPAMSVASSLSKDFRPGAVPDARHSVPVVSSSYQRMYTPAEIGMMHDKAAVIPPTPAVPVSALRFTTTSVNVPQASYRQTTSAQASATIQKLLSLKPGDERIPPGLNPILQGAYRPPPMSQTVSLPRFGSITTGTPVLQPPIPSSAPQPSTMPNPINSLPHRPASNLVSIRSGKPVARNPLLNPIDGHDKPTGSKPTTCSAPVRQIISQIPSVGVVTMTKQPQYVDVPKIVASLPPAPLLPGQAPVFWHPGLQPGGRFSTSALSQLQEQLKSEKVGDGAAGLLIQQKLDESRMMEAYHLQSRSGFIIPSGMEPRSIPELAAMSKRKTSEEPSPSPKSVQHVIQRSATPPQIKVAERKASRGPTPGRVPSEAAQRHASPMAQDRTTKEELKRPDSASRHTPDRRGGMESTLSSSQRSLSAYSLAPTSRSLAEAQTQELHAQAIDPLLLRHGYPLIPQPLPGKQAETLAVMQHYLMNQYAAAGMVHGLPPGSLGPFVQSNPNENMESSRHNVLTHDFATAMQMKQHLPSPASVAPRGSPFSTITPVTSGHPPVVVSMSSNPLHPLVASHHPNSPISSRPTFTSQNPSSISSNPQHSRTTSNPIRTPSKSPSSPHRSSTPHHITKPPYPSPGPQLYPHMSEMFHPGVERRKSSSPHRIPSSDYHTLATQSALATQFAAHEARRTPPSSYGTPPPPRQTPSADRAISGSPLVTQRSSSSPHLAQGRGVKREPEHRGMERDITNTSELHSGQPSHPQGERTPSLTSHPQQHRSSHESLQQERKEPNDRSDQVDDRGIPFQGFEYGARHVKTASDLRIKGRATMTPAHLIHAIIDHNINQEYEGSHPVPHINKPMSSSPSTHSQKPPPTHSQKPPSTSQRQEPEQRHPPKPPMSRTQQEPPQQPPISRQHVVAPSSFGLERFEEHSHGIITDMFHRESNEKKVLEQRQQDALKAQAMMSGIPLQDRSSIIQHPLAPQACQNPSTPLETLIRTALLNHEGSSRGGSPAPADIMERSSRIDSSNRSSPVVRSSVSSPILSKGAELKRETSQYSNTSAPTSVNPAPIFISALAFKAGQNTTSNQPIPPPSNLAPRSSVVSGPSGVHAPHMSPYHPHGQPPNPQTQHVPVERPPPMAANQFEELSDSD